jgi:hypothetical protein
VGAGAARVDVMAVVARTKRVVSFILQVDFECRTEGSGADVLGDELEGNSTVP